MGFFNLSIGKGDTKWLDLVFKAREMWLANVSFQNAMEYLVLS